MGGLDDSERKSLMKRLMEYKQYEAFGGRNLMPEEVVGEAQAHLFVLLLMLSLNVLTNR